MGLAPATVGVVLKQTGQPLEFTPINRERIRSIVARYPEGRSESAVLPVLWVAQEQFGFISEEAANLVAQALAMSPTDVAAVATFYTMFHLEPVGRHLLQICCTLSCSLMGAEVLAQRLETRLGIRPGETTPDGRFTLKRVECLAACGGAPVVQVNETFHENLDAEKLDRLLDSLP